MAQERADFTKDRENIFSVVKEELEKSHALCHVAHSAIARVREQFPIIAACEWRWHVKARSTTDHKLHTSIVQDVPDRWKQEQFEDCILRVAALEVRTGAPLHKFDTLTLLPQTLVLWWARMMPAMLKFHHLGERIQQCTDSGLEKQPKTSSDWMFPTL